MKGTFTKQRLLEIASEYICEHWTDFCQYYEQELLFGAGFEEQEQTAEELNQLFEEYSEIYYNLF